LVIGEPWTKANQGAKKNLSKTWQHFVKKKTTRFIIECRSQLEQTYEFWSVYIYLYQFLNIQHIFDIFFLQLSTFWTNLLAFIDIWTFLSLGTYRDRRWLFVDILYCLEF
jgi:hypothetical protein